MFHPLLVRKKKPMLMSDYKSLSKLFSKKLGFVKYKFKPIFSKVKFTDKKKRITFKKIFAKNQTKKRKNKPIIHASI